MHAVSLRRTIKILKALGGDVGHYYLWILERIYWHDGRDDQTIFKGAEAAAALGVNERTIQNYNDRFRNVFPKWITIEQTFFLDKDGKPRQGSNKYTVHPINDLIDDDGYKPQKRGKNLARSRKLSGGMGESCFTRVGEKSFSTSGLPFLRTDSNDSALTNGSPRTSSPPAPQSSLRVTSSTEAGGAAAAAIAPGCEVIQPARQSRPAPFQGFDVDEVVQPVQLVSAFDVKAARWVEDHSAELAGLGFQHRATDKVVSDMQSCFHSDESLLDSFMKSWPLIRRKIATIDWIKKPKRAPLGYGWLFRRSLQQPSETNLQVIAFSNALGGETIINTAYGPGDLIKYPANSGVGFRTLQLIRPISCDGKQWKACKPKFFGTPHQDYDQETVFIGNIVKEQPQGK